MTGIKHRIRQAQPAAIFIIDCGAWWLAILAAKFIRLEFQLSAFNWERLTIVLTCTVLLQAFWGYIFGVYRRRWRFASLDEIVSLSKAILAVGLSVFSLLAFSGQPLGPRSVPLIAIGFAMLLVGAVRVLWRVTKVRVLRSSHTERLLIVGAGEAAAQVVRALNNDSTSAYLPIAAVDDDPHKRHLRFEHIRVEGAVGDLASVAKQHQCNSVLLAIPSGDEGLLQRVNTLCRNSNLQLLTLPPAQQLFGAVAATDIRPITHADLLGRDTTNIDVEVVRSQIAGRRVLVTGAGGSIGSELCRQLARLSPAALVMLDRDESGLQATQLSIDGRGLLDDRNLVLADIRDAERMHEVFRCHQPEVVFHAAALKHLPLLEHAPAEAWKTNVLGTANVLSAAQEVGVSMFVNISTDKAANPTSVLGTSKRITECLTADYAANSQRYLSVRFGNVLGSRGSVINTFRAQADAGGPITVTHPEVTRYFMTVEEAMRLTIYASAIGASGEVLVLDMGEPVRLLDVATRFANQHNPPLDIVFTGLRPGEKLHEDLVADGEQGVRREHPLISHVSVSPVPKSRLHEFASLDVTAINGSIQLLSAVTLASQVS